MVGLIDPRMVDVGREAVTRQATPPEPVVHEPPERWRFLVAVARLPGGALHEVPVRVRGLVARVLLIAHRAGGDGVRQAAQNIRDGALPHLPAGAVVLSVEQVTEALLEAFAYVSHPDRPFMVVDALDTPVGCCETDWGAASTVESWTHHGGGKHTGTAPWRVVKVPAHQCTERAS